MVARGIFNPGKVKAEKFYDYTKIPIFLVAAFLTLVFASSVESEAGLGRNYYSSNYWVVAKLKNTENLTKKQKTVTYSFAIAMGLTSYVVLFSAFRNWNEMKGATWEQEHFDVFWEIQDSLMNSSFLFRIMI